MGQISHLTSEQKIIFDGISKNKFISDNFYFTGGTALSEFYLHHRYSEDLDFFTDKSFDHQHVFFMMETLKKKHRFTFRSEAVANVYMFYIQFSPRAELKVDFNYYPYKRIENAVIKNNLRIDSLLDISVNKLLTITQRNDVKDFVDFYYLEPKFGVWDLMVGVRVKFGLEIDPWFLSSDFLKIDDFPVLPRMIKPLALETLKKFFREKAREVGKTAVK